jgi:rod shape-determining protein MreC
VIRLSPQRRASLQRIAFPVLVVLSITAILLGKADQLMFQSARVAAANAAAPLLAALSQPLSAAQQLIGRARSAVDIYGENQRLREENEKLLHWQQTALRLAAENADFRNLLKVVPEPAVSYLTARVISYSGGAYVRSVLIDAGGGDGVGRGQAAVTSDGLVGRVSEVGSRVARVLLVTDLNSRVPVTIERAHARAVLAGDNSPRPALLYLEPQTAVKIGDRVVTSGDGGLFPPGLPVGIVAAIDDGMPRVEPAVGLSQVDYLRIVDYGLARSLPAPVPLAPHAPRRAAGPGPHP